MWIDLKESEMIIVTVHFYIRKLDCVHVTCVFKIQISFLCNFIELHVNNSTWFAESDKI